MGPVTRTKDFKIRIYTGDIQVCDDLTFGNMMGDNRNAGCPSLLFERAPKEAREGIPALVHARGRKWRCLVVSDSILLLRCPYCTAGLEFRTLVSYQDGRFACEQCGHTVRPGESDYQCSCRECLKWRKVQALAPKSGL